LILYIQIILQLLNVEWSFKIYPLPTLVTVCYAKVPEGGASVSTPLQPSSMAKTSEFMVLIGSLGSENWVFFGIPQVPNGENDD
jgi:hypothetical protein